MPMLMPETGGRKDQITTKHGTLFSAHQGPRTLALHHHANGIGRMAVRRRQLPRQQQLHAQVHGRAGLHFVQTMARIGKDQHASFGLLDRRQRAGLNQQLTDIAVGPMRRLCLTRWNIGRQYAAQARPQRHQVALRQSLAVCQRQVFQTSQCVKPIVVVHVCCHICCLKFVVTPAE